MMHQIKGAAAFGSFALCQGVLQVKITHVSVSVEDKIVNQLSVLVK